MPALRGGFLLWGLVLLGERHNAMIQNLSRKAHKAVPIASAIFFLVIVTACNKSPATKAPERSPTVTEQTLAPPVFKEQTMKLDASAGCDTDKNALGFCILELILNDLPARTQGFETYPVGTIQSVAEGYSISFLDDNQAMSFIYEVEVQQSRVKLSKLKQVRSTTFESDSIDPFKNQKFEPGRDIVNEKLVPPVNLGRKYLCESGEFNRSVCIIDAMLQDRLERDPVLSGGTVRDVTRVSDEVYVLAVSRNEGVDLYKYEFNLFDSSIEMKSRSYGITDSQSR
jgi:hypothetical protein